MIVGIDIGGTKCAVSLGEVSEEGRINILDKIAYKTSDYPDPYQMMDKLKDGVEVFMMDEERPEDYIESIGISCGGPLDSKRGVILSPPNLPGWNAVPIVSSFEKKFGVPTSIQNDANACALAEWKLGAGRGLKNVIFLTFGTGMGAGLILDGKLYSGTNDMAGEIGHVRLADFGPVGYGKTGSFEGFCSGSGIAQLGRLKVKEKFQMGEHVSFCKDYPGLDSINAQVVAEAAEKGDPLAKEVYDISGSYLGKGLSILVDILNPEAIIIGSIFSRARELLLPSMEEQLAKETLSASRSICKILPAGLGEKLGDYAALSVAAYNLDLSKSFSG